MKPIILLLSLLFVISSCSKNIYSTSKKAYRKQAKVFAKELKNITPIYEGAEVLESQNIDQRKPQFIIIHHTAQDSCEQTYHTFSLARTEVSSHYVICEDGTVTQMLSDYLRGWHAGKGKWFSITDMNSISLGIELDNTGKEEFAEAQIESLIELLIKLTEAYEIPKENIIGHADWAPGRKVDPSKYFPWKKLAQNGLGMWYDEEKLTTVVLPENFEPIVYLQLLGYDTSVPTEAFYSFKLHFDGFDGSAELTELDKKKLYLLVSEK